MSTETSQEFSPHSNIPEMSVSELSFSLKRTLEETYGRVRIRGELSRISIPSSGHLYSDLKDEQSVINLICWKGNLNKLSIKPEEGLEVICTGKVSSYPKSSRYQLIVESMELAGEGALLKMLEERRKKLAAEGIFSEERKKKLPIFPKTIGVITSPTGAVIRDILHRLNDRFPCHVLLWPVAVQGNEAAEQITNAINGFNNIDNESPLKRPDIIIVARGGGSLEDLMAFNEENVVRAVSECDIPVISAIGHETDTTLIDHAADLRAPTPTGAAEMSVPVRTELMAQLADDQGRLLSIISQLLENRRSKLETQGAKLGDPAQLLEIKNQMLDNASQRITSIFEKIISAKNTQIAQMGAMIKHPKSLMEEKKRTLNIHSQSLIRAGVLMFKNHEHRLTMAGKMLESLSIESVLERGFVVIHDENGKPITEAEQTSSGQNIKMRFKNNRLIDATIGKVKAANNKNKGGKNTDTNDNQGKLL
jgi:exodeoxyribonuclease VII large subunit